MVWVKKQGKTGIYYVDNIAALPPDQRTPMNTLPIRGYSHTPDGIAIPQPMHKIISDVGLENVKIIEPIKKNKESTKQISAARVAEVMGKNAPDQAKGPSVASAPIHVNADLHNACVAQLKDYFARLTYAKGKERTTLKRDIEAIATFLVRVDAAWETIIKDVKDNEEEKNRRFTLD